MQKKFGQSSYLPPLQNPSKRQKKELTSSRRQGRDDQGPGGIISSGEATTSHPVHYQQETTARQMGYVTNCLVDTLKDI